jgi:hypothetical protein
MKDQDKKELAMLAGLTKTQVAAKAAFAKKPKDAKVKKAYIDATMKLADAELISPALLPKEKYPRSLRHYREVRKADPKNAKAIEQIALIEGIYKSMNRPIPPN